LPESEQQNTDYYTYYLHLLDTDTPSEDVPGRTAPKVCDMGPEQTRAMPMATKSPSLAACE